MIPRSLELQLANHHAALGTEAARAPRRAARCRGSGRGSRATQTARPNPTGCYWDPRPGELTGTWHELLTHKAVDVAAAKRARDAALRREETTRAARARASALGSMGAGCSSFELVTQRTSACMAPSLSAEAPARRVRDIEYAAELLGLRLDVPWSIWDGYEAGVREPGILWRYDAEERTFRGRGGGGGVICESEMLPRQYVCQAGARSDAWREARMGREGGVEDWLVNNLSVFI